MADRRRTRGVKREKKGRSDLGSLYELGVTRDQMQAVSDIHALVDGNTPKSFARNVKSAAKEREEKRFEDGLMKSFFALSAAQSEGLFEKASDSLQQLAESQKTALYERLDKTLKRLRQKGYCNETTMEAFAIHADEFVPAANPCMAILPPSFTGFRFNRRKVNRVVKKYNDQMWMQSIELACLLTQPESVFDMNNPTLVLQAEKNISLIYCLFFHLALIGAYNVSEELKNRVENSEKTAESIVQEARKEAEKAKAEYRRELERAKREAFETAERLKRQNKVLEKELYALRRENALRKMLMELAEVEAEDSEPDDSELEAEDAVDVAEEELYRDIQVPEDGSIVLLGGHPAWIKKVRQLHPGWKYVTSDNQRGDNILSIVQGNIRCVIFFWQHVSHSMCATLKNAIGDDTPIIYLNCRNLDRVEHLIRKQYAEQVLGLTREALSAK